MAIIGCGSVKVVSHLSVGRVSDYLRIQELDDGRNVVLFANASMGDFEWTSPKTSAQFLDEIATIAVAETDPLLERIMQRSAEWVRQREPLAMWVTAAVISSESISVRWVSGDEIWIANRDIISVATQAQTLGNLRSDLMTAPNYAAIESILLRGIGDSYGYDRWEQAEIALRDADEHVFVVSFLPAKRNVLSQFKEQIEAGSGYYASVDCLVGLESVLREGPRNGIVVMIPTRRPN